MAAVLGLGLTSLTGLSAGQAAATPAVADATGALSARTAADADSGWTALSGRLPAARNGATQRVNPSEYAAYTLDAPVLDRVLDRAPDEDAGRAGTLLSVPAPTGELVTFRVVDSPVMEDGLAAAHPEITTYAGTAVDSGASIRLDVTPMGFHAAVRGAGGSWYVDPAFNGDDSVYLSYLGTALPAPEKGLIEPEIDESALDGARAPRAGEPAQGDAVLRRTFRLALLTDPSYARYFGTENVLAEKVTLMNRVNQIYNDDLAIRLLLIDETDRLNIDSDEKAFGPDGGCGSAGCFTPNQFASGCTGGLLNRNRIALGQLVGASAYDIGHVALGINGGGVAGLGVVGGDGKARGCTGLPQPEGDFMAIDYVAHEMGHQFGGNHTFNGNQVNCGGNKAAPSVEPGSGSSVMAYAGICRQDDLQPHTDPYFSQWSQTEMTANLVATKALVDEVQTVSLNGFDTDGESFTLSYGGATTTAITRGTTYTAAAIKAALEAILPNAGIVNVTAFGANNGTPNDTGFQLRFNGTTNPLAGQDLLPIGITVVSGDATGFVGETARGGANTNAGLVIDSPGNHTPVVTATPQVSIPLRTPFALTGQATDADGDDMIYLWEQNDRGGQGTGTSLVSQTKPNGPLFRVFGTYADVTPAGTLLIGSPGENAADGNPTRTFPDIEQILVNNTNAETGLCPEAPPSPASGASNVPVPTRDCFSEWLPTIDYVGSPLAANDVPLSMNFRFTARDLNPVAGGYSFANTKVLIDNTAGPFLVSSKNVAAAAVAGRTEVLSWAVAGTNKPTLAENVTISLSTDGGRTFPVVLAESTPNDGSQAVTWPNIATTTARIKIEAVGNVFFDINNADFQIVPKLLVDGPGAASYDVQYSDTPAGVSISVESGSVDGADLTAVASGLPAGLSLVADAVSADGVRPGTATYVVSGTADDALGTYPVSVTIGDGTEPDVVKTFDVVVAAEDASVTYTGPSTATVPVAGSPVEVTALVAPSADGTPGDPTTATVTFADGDDVLCADAPVSATGEATCSFEAAIGDYAIDLTVGGRYVGTSSAAGDLAVDLAPAPEVPETSIVSGPADGAILVSRDTSFTVTSTGTDATYACTLDGASVDCAAGTATFTALLPGTHRFEATSTADGVTDATPVSSAFTIPVDDVGLRKTRGSWKRQVVGNAYNRTLTTTRTQYATLSYRVADATSLSLVAPTRAKGGKVRVYLDGRRLAQRSLTSSTFKAKQVIAIADFAAPTSGLVTIVSMSKKNAVRIDGLAVVTPTVG